MDIIDNYIVHEGIEYSAERLKEIRKKKYKSNEYWWVYVGGDDYAEMPLHVYVWNLHHPHARVKPNDGKLIDHKDENKENNAPSNLIRCKKCDHDSNHMTKRRKEQPKKFSAATASKGGKNAHKKHPELKDNLKGKKKVKESVELVEESVIFLGVTIGALIYTTVTTILGVWSTISFMKSLRKDDEVSKKLTSIVNDGRSYIVRKQKTTELNAFALPDNQQIVYYTGIRKKLNEREFYAILLHEVGHLRQKEQHIRFKSWAADSFVITLIVNAMTALALGGALHAILAVWILKSLVLDLIPLSVSRYFEYDADSYAVKKGYGKELASALAKFADYYKLNIKPCKTVGCKVHKKMEHIYSTHPEMSKRIEGILKEEELYKKLVKNGLSGAFAFASDFLDITIGDPAKKLASLIMRKM